MQALEQHNISPYQGYGDQPGTSTQQGLTTFVRNKQLSRHRLTWMEQYPNMDS